jgi:DNA-binding GntR family transcriptional regulator
MQPESTEVAPLNVRLPELPAARPPSAADQVFEALYNQVVTLALPPGTRLSEAEVARAAGVSRQPVRDAFWRLSQLGFLTIRPQRSTEVSIISEEAVQQARFVRTALEVETIRLAAEHFGPEEVAALEAVMTEQAAAIAADDREGFHALDDEFHRRICALCGHEYAWALIREQKAHMDRVRYLSLSFGAQVAYDDHRMILDAVRAGDVPGSVAAMRTHLSRLVDHLPRIRAEHGEQFARVPRGGG